jgi:hypothetical protein
MNDNFFTGYFDHKYDDFLKVFIDNLPSGSGIDCEWSGNMPKSGDYVTFGNSYHCMNENGFYDGYQDFFIRILKVDFIRLALEYHKVTNYLYHPAIDKAKRNFLALLDFIRNDFTLHYSGGNYKAEKYYLIDYLLDTIAYSFEMMGEEVTK